MDKLLIIPLLVCLVAIIRPLPRLWLPTRKRAALVGFGVFITIGFVVDPTEPTASAPARTPTESTASTPAKAPTEPSRALEPSTIPVERISAVSLHATYTGNEIHGDERFKDKRLRVYGRIASIGKTDYLKNPVVHLVADAYGVHSVNCIFPSDGTSEVRHLTQGQSVEIEGKCTGLTGPLDMSVATMIGSVTLKNCRLVQ